MYEIVCINKNVYSLFKKKNIIYFILYILNIILNNVYIVYVDFISVILDSIQYCLCLSCCQCQTTRTISRTGNIYILLYYYH